MPGDLWDENFGHYQVNKICAWIEGALKLSVGAGMFRILLGAVCANLFATVLAHAQTVDIARFVAPVTVRSVSLSPSGAYAAYIRRGAAGEEIVVVDLAANSTRTIESVRRTHGVFNWVAWKGDDHVLAGVEAFMTGETRRPMGSSIPQRGRDYSVYRVVSISRDGSGFVQMFEGQLHRLAWGFGSTQLLDALPNDPGHVLLIASDNLGIGVWRADVATGRAERVADGAWDTRSYATDGAGYPVMRLDALADRSGYRVMRRAHDATDWTFVMEARGDFLRSNSPDFYIIGSGPGPNQVYVFARLEGQDRGAVYLYDTGSGSFGDLVYASGEADVSSLWVNPSTREVIGGCTYAQRLVCEARAPAVQRHMNAVNAFFQGGATVSLVDMSADTSKWLLRVDSPTEGAGYFVYDVSRRNMAPLAAIYPNVDLALLSPTHVEQYRSRDGVSLWAYVTARPGEGRRAMVVLPHGGPESRDTYGYDAYVQFLAAHGYVVVQPNFRGSLGFGNNFADAGRGQWGRRMQDDVTDAVRHLIDTGVADPSRICIVGASYGGYAALAGVALTPELYRCGISISGISDLLDVLRSERIESGRRSSAYQYWRRSIGDPGANGDALAAASPARLAGNITAPVLLIHGEEDETVLIRQSELMEQAMRRAGRAARLVRLEGADHYWDSWSTENRTILFRETESFLAQHLGPAPP